MSNVITLPIKPAKTSAVAQWEETTAYGEIGPVLVALARRTDITDGMVHVVMLGSVVGLEVIASLPDDEKGRAIADFTGPAAFRAMELSETEFAARPEAC